MRGVLAAILALIGFGLVAIAVLMVLSLRHPPQGWSGLVWILMVVPLSLMGFLGGHGVFLLATFLGRNKFIRGLSALMGIVDALTGLLLAFIMVEMLIRKEYGGAVFTLVILTGFGGLVFWFFRKAWKG